MTTDPSGAALSPKFGEAFLYAASLHARQRRKGAGIPYLAHLMSVAALVLEDGGDEEEAIAALLHDSVEDQDADLEEIGNRFGAKVARIVSACTDSQVKPKPPWEDRKRRYVEHIRQAPPDVVRVSSADKLHNARSILADFRSIGDALWSRFSATRDQTLWYYRSLVTAFREAGGSSLVDELDRVVTRLEREVARRVDSARQVGDSPLVDSAELPSPPDVGEG
jgi:(p)ppGpp synthase/HD superfamily hydrolase